LTPGAPGTGPGEGAGDGAGDGTGGARDAEVARLARALPSRPVLVDVGVRGGFPDGWAAAVRGGAVTGVGLDPDAGHLDGLRDRWPGALLVAAAVGAEPGPATLYETRLPGCSSVLAPNRAVIDRFPARAVFDVVGARVVHLTTLDALVAEGRMPAFDFLKIDTQGFDDAVLAGAERALEGAAAVRLEAHLRPLYEGQALLWDVLARLERHGFVLRHLAPRGPFEGEVIEVDAWFARRYRAADPDLCRRLRLWEIAEGLPRPMRAADPAFGAWWRDRWGLDPALIALDDDDRAAAREW